ncbi:MAG: DUF1501 domain-containing protein [Myxococcales bacterium]|nr:DUF1501 domain-containing protein [Myxococcales bacterium]
MPTRRDLLIGGAALGGSLLLPRSSRAAVAPEDRKFIFVYVNGGWDPTKVFMASMANSITVGRSAGDEAVTHGPFRLITNPNRPAVDVFFDRFSDRVALLDGVLIRSINHPICRNLWMTNTPNAGRPDWPATLGFAAADRYPVPNMIVDGYSMAGEYSAYTALAGRKGQLQEMVSGTATLRGEPAYAPPPGDLEALMDQFVSRRAGERAAQVRAPLEGHLTNAYVEASTRLVGFKEATAGLDFDTGTTLLSQIPLAVQLLQGGVARCVTLSHNSGVWDTHIDNSEQDAEFGRLFEGLTALMDVLDQVPGQHASTLAEETVVLVFSEMGRTPYLNSTGGKDHWMYTTGMIWGAGVVGGRGYGGYDDNLNGLLVDLASGDTVSEASGGVPITPDVIGSTLMRLGGIDPVAELGEDTSLRGLLA